MLRPYEMSRILVSGPSKAQDAVVRELHKLKVLHIISHSRNDLADIGQPMENAGRLSELMVKARALIAALNIKKSEAELSFNAPLAEISIKIKELAEEINKNNEELKRVDEFKAKNEYMLGELKNIENIM